VTEGERLQDSSMLQNGLLMFFVEREQPQISKQALSRGRRSHDAGDTGCGRREGGEWSPQAQVAIREHFCVCKQLLVTKSGSPVEWAQTGITHPHTLSRTATNTSHVRFGVPGRLSAHKKNIGKSWPSWNVPGNGHYVTVPSAYDPKYDALRPAYTFN
jgi:hypothetical protein